MAITAPPAPLAKITAMHCRKRKADRNVRPDGNTGAQKHTRGTLPSDIGGDSRRREQTRGGNGQPSCDQDQRHEARNRNVGEGVEPEGERKREAARERNKASTSLRSVLPRGPLSPKPKRKKHKAA